MKVLFLHGWHSTPGGVKPTYLKSHGHEVLNPALSNDDFDEAVKIAQVERVERKTVSVGNVPRQREAGVPRQFGIGILMVITAMYAILFSVMRALRFPSTPFFIVALFFTVVGLGQMFLYKGQRPRRASAMVGIGFMSCVWGIILIIEGVKGGVSMSSGGQIVFGLVFVGFAYGAIFGYLAGLLIAGVFLVIDALAKRRGGSETAEPVERKR